MTRIVSGRWGGRHLTVPRDRAVRPTAERVREAWLNILAPRLAGANVLDLCAGSGALGLEALSRGASHATFVELHAGPMMALRANIAGLDAGSSTTVARDDAIRFVGRLGPGAYDLALADPPFASDLAQQLIDAWHEAPFAAVLAVEHPRQRQFPGAHTRHWGDIAVSFLEAA